MTDPNFLITVSPEGKLAIVKSRIVALVACAVPNGRNKLKPIKTKIFVENDSDAYNSLETVDTILSKF